MTRRPFLLAGTIDFTDDTQYFPFTQDLLAQIMDAFQQIGVRRLYWQYDQAGQWHRLDRDRPTLRQTLQNLGGYPMGLAGQLAHQRDMEFWAVIKPFEAGEALTTPLSRPSSRAGWSGDTYREANPWTPGLPCIGGLHRDIDPWMLSHPEMRVRARTAGPSQGLEGVPVERIQLRQRDMAPNRIKPENLEIWTSPDNLFYQKQDVTFTLEEGADTCRRDVFDLLGDLVTRRGDPIRVLELRGLHLTDAFIAITTNFEEFSGSFRNTAIEMIRAFGPGDQPLPITVASHKSVWRRPRDLRHSDLQFDGGIGDVNVCLDVNSTAVVCPHCRENGRSDCMQMPLFPEEPTCRDGVIAFARGHNAYLPCAPCEAYPEVQAMWMEWVGECLLAGVDGIDWRISNHSSWTNTPELYGFNPPITEEYERRYGVNPDRQPYDPELLADLRGEFYDHFLLNVQRRLAAAGKKLQHHFEAESFRPDAPQARRRTRPGQMNFHWRHWLRSGLIEEATLMGFRPAAQILADPLTQEMLAEARAASVPVHLRHHMFNSRDGQTNADRMEYAFRDERLSGYNYYDSACLYMYHQPPIDGRLQFYPGMLEALRERALSLGLLR
jgi:hypothetical protein